MPRCQVLPKLPPTGGLGSFTNLATSQATSYGYGPSKERVRITGPGGTRRIFGSLFETTDSAGSGSQTSSPTT